MCELRWDLGEKLTLNVIRKMTRIKAMSDSQLIIGEYKVNM